MHSRLKAMPFELIEKSIRPQTKRTPPYSFFHHLPIVIAAPLCMKYLCMYIFSFLFVITILSAKTNPCEFVYDIFLCTLLKCIAKYIFHIYSRNRYNIGNKRTRELLFVRSGFFRPPPSPSFALVFTSPYMPLTCTYSNPIYALLTLIAQLQPRSAFICTVEGFSNAITKRIDFDWRYTRLLNCFFCVFYRLRRSNF